MKKYFFLQLKRVLRYFPYILLVSLVLFGAISAGLWSLLSANEDKSENHKIKVGITGSLDDRMIQLGLATFEAFDDTKYTLELLQLEEAQANASLARGDIALYIVVPEDFVRQALHGSIEPIRFVTTTDTTDVVTLFKDEILQMITQIVVSAQKGTYGIGDALTAAGRSDLSYEHINKIAVEYVYLALERTEGVVVEELGIRHALTMPQYYVISLGIFFLLLMSLPFAILYCKKNHSLEALLHSKGVSAGSQTGGEFLSLFIGMLGLIGMLMLGIILFINFSDFSDAINSLSTGGGCPFLALVLPVVMITAFTYMIFELAGNVVGGVLSHFFLTVSLCYLSGCFYPLYAFPEAVQKVAAVLPVCVLREQMAQFFSGHSSLWSTVAVFAYTILFFGIGFMSKKHRLLSRGGGSL